MKSNLKYCYPFLFFLAIGSLTSLVSCDQKPTKNVEIRGIYGHPRSFWDKGLKLNDLGVNAVFVHSESIDQQMINRARSEGLQVFAEFATLNGKNYVETHPEAWAINEKGERVQPASWFMGVCPTEPGFRQYRFDKLRLLLTDYDLDGVWMDYVHWHAQFEEPEPILPETCFCDHCLSKFSKDTGIEIMGETAPEKADWILDNHDQQWRDWRCRVINDWAGEIKTIIKDIRPHALLGIYHSPWNDEEFNGARRRILGLDYDMLKENVDVFSPMVYHGRMGKDAEWVRKNITWLCDRLNISIDSYPKVWPIVQASNEPGIISIEEFESVLIGGLAGKSSGVMMFTAGSVAGDEGKIAVMKKIYTQLSVTTEH